MTTISTPEGIALFQFRARIGALKMELLGMKRRGRSAYSILKSEHGYKGSRQSVYDQALADYNRLMEESS